MDLDPTLYSPHNDAAPARTPSPPSAPLPAFDLPSAPRPSVSPSVSRVFQKKQHDSAPTMSRGLDLSVPPSPHRHDSLADPASSSSQVGAHSSPLSPLRGPGLTSSTPCPQDDPRDTASARDNIQALVSAGQRNSTSSSTPPSLAMFMGGGPQRRTHRIGTGMTEQEKDETDRLEREMAATRAKWGDKGAQGDADPPRSGLSLADLMKGGKGGASASPVAAKVAQRFHAEPERASSAPAAAPAAAPAEAPDAAPAAAPPLVEAKIVSRSPPAEAKGPAQPQKSASAPPPAGSDPSPPPSSAPASAAFTAEPETATLPRSTSFGLGGASNTLTRLQSSGVVADRLKWTEALQQPDPASAPPAQPSAPPSPEKRRSVLERWGRDEPNAGAPASPSRQRSFALEAGAPRDEARKGVEDLFSPRNDDKAPSSAAAPASSAPVDAASPTKSSYSKPTWSAAPIGVKEPSKPSSPPPIDNDDEPASPPVRHTRGVALPGLGPSGSSAPKPAPSTSASARPSPLAFPSEPSSPIRTRTQSSDAPPASPGRPSVRAAAQRWGQTAAQSAAEKSEALQALKASYGVKLGPTRGATLPASSSAAAAAITQERRSEVEAPAKSKSVEVPAHTPAPAQEKKEQPFAARTASPAPQTKPAPTPSPASAPTAASRSAAAPTNPASPSNSAAPTLADDVVAALLAPRHVAHLPPGEVLSLDVFHLNSPSDDPHPIDHNHMLFESEVVGVVYRAAAAGEGEGDEEGILTRTWVWRGRDAQPTARTEERIARLGEKTGTTPVEAQAGAEGAELAEAFAGQLTVCRVRRSLPSSPSPSFTSSTDDDDDLQGTRDSFDHLAQHMFSVQSHDDAVFVEEADVVRRVFRSLLLSSSSPRSRPLRTRSQSIRTLCSGYATVFSSLGEVYAWLGEGSTDLERHAACEFAESLADGRSVEVLAEGEETALFWHQLAADGAEYANAHVRHFLSSASPTRLPHPTWTKLTPHWHARSTGATALTTRRPSRSSASRPRPRTASPSSRRPPSRPTTSRSSTPGSPRAGSSFPRLCSSTRRATLSSRSRRPRSSPSSGRSAALALARRTMCALLSFPSSSAFTSQLVVLGTPPPTQLAHACSSSRRSSSRHRSSLATSPSSLAPSTSLRSAPAPSPARCASTRRRRRATSYSRR